MKYEIIIFDADETLFDFKKSERHAFKNTMLEFNIAYDESHHLEIYQGINTTIWKEFEDGLITQKALKTERFIRLADKLKSNFDPLTFSKSYMKHLSHASFLYEDSTQVIEGLHKSYRLIIVTNGLKDVQDNRIRKSVLAKHFEDIVVSEEIGVSKPNPKIFEHALNNINYTNKKKVLIVGDSLTSDIQGGINFGIDTCWYNPNKISNDQGIHPTYEVSSLLKIQGVIEKGLPS